MKSHVFTLFVFCLALLTAHPSFSQKAPEKFGKIDITDLNMTHYPLDSSAHAVILFDYGVAELEYEPQIGDFFINFKRHVRYKIIDQGGYDYADFSIPLYDATENSETPFFTRRVCGFEGIL